MLIAGPSRERLLVVQKSEKQIVLIVEDVAADFKGASSIIQNDTRRGGPGPNSHARKSHVNHECVRMPR